MATVYKFPGQYFKEVEFAGTVRPITGIDTSIAGLIGYFKKGPINTPVLCENMEQVVDKFGGAISGGYGWYVADGFFKNGGKSLWISRSAHYTDLNDASTLTAKKSSIVLKNLADTDAYKVEVKSEGVYGNLVSVTAKANPKVSTKVMSIADIGNTVITVESLKNCKIGMNIYIGANFYVIKEFDNELKSVTLTTPLVAAIAVNDVVKSYEFDLTIYNNGKSVEEFTGISLDSLEDNYFEYYVNKESKIINISDMKATVTKDKTMIKDLINQVYLSGGNDGLANITVSDLKGVKATRTGIWSFEKVTDSMNIFCAESQDVSLNRALYEYAEYRMDCFPITTFPEGYTPDDAIKYRTDTGNFNTSYGALYYQWGYVDDPIGVGRKPEKNIPLVGHIAGYYASSDRANGGPHITPAGEEAVLKGVNRLEREIDNDIHGTLNVLGINCLRSFPGLGIVIWGGRTLSMNPKWRYINARRIFIYVEKSVLLGTRWSVFKPTGPTTWKPLVRSITAFLSNVRGLAGDKPQEKYAVICDETNNPQSVRDDGQIVTTIGLNIEGVGEFVLFNIGQMREGATITA